MRKAFQGSFNIIRFNWHFYASVFVFSFFLLVLISLSYGLVSILGKVLLTFIVLTTITSLVVSYYVYDFSNLYSFDWMDTLAIKEEDVLVNIHSGFDESSSIIQNKFQGNLLHILDFYDPKKHTEVSIKRARKAYPAFPSTKRVSTTSLKLENDSASFIFLIFSAHEIRNEKERVLFFNEVNRISKSNASIIILEHQRDFSNFLAYNVGFFHFLSKATWLKTFKKSNLEIEKIKKENPFVTLYYLKNGNPT